MHASQAANKLKGENKVLERTNEKGILFKGLAALLCAARVNEGERSEVLSCHGGDVLHRAPGWGQDTEGHAIPWTPSSCHQL